MSLWFFIGSEKEEETVEDHLDYTDGFLAAEGPDNVEPEAAAVKKWESIISISNLAMHNVKSLKTNVYSSKDTPMPEILKQFFVVPYTKGWFFIYISHLLYKLNYEK